MNVFVSIVMPSYDTNKFIAEAINSVLAKTYTYWELLVIDDCSTETDSVVAHFNGSRICYFKNEKSICADVSPNRALREAKCKWIAAFLDSYDLLLPGEAGEANWLHEKELPSLSIYKLQFRRIGSKTF